MSFMKYFVIFAFTLLYANGQSNDCPSSSKDWCKDMKTAVDCNVLEQCNKFVWQPNSIRVDPGLVNLTLYYESLCPDSKQFINTQLLYAFGNISSIMNLTLVPYGNANETWRNETKLWQFSCQHGPDECLGNLIHTCFINYYTKTENQFPFIQCMMSNNVDDVMTAATKCGTQLNVTLTQVFTCAKSRIGNNLEHVMAMKTYALIPKHTYVPWVVLNDLHTDAIQEQAETDLIKLICDTYQGPNKPDVCS